MGDLLPCPFCGSMPRMRPFAEPFKGVAVTCQTPNCPASPISTGAALADPHVNVNAWNRRAEAAEAEAAALRAKVARLEGALTDMPKAVLRTTVCQGPQWPDDRPGVWLAALEACAKSVQAAVDAALTDGGKDG